jgi:hypothetical protein
MSDRYQHLFRKSLDAKRGGQAAWSVQSTGERVAVALVLNRADWLAEIGYTIPEAMGVAAQSGFRSSRRSPANLKMRRHSHAY